jgi:hypothetical protein
MGEIRVLSRAQEFRIFKKYDALKEFNFEPNQRLELARTIEAPARVLADASVPVLPSERISHAKADRTRWIHQEIIGQVVELIRLRRRS